MYNLQPSRRKNNDLIGNFFGRDMINDFFNNDFFNTDLFFDSNTGIKADIKQNDKEYIIEAEVPGFDKDEIEVNIENNYLTISAKRNEEINEESKNYIRKERKINTVSRSFYVDDVKANLINADYKNGILTIKMPKDFSVKPKTKRIDIK